mmetsp:Transcript_14299/g.22045  ORF Transcript_14299/g.22045 Transcript_14299/m.22045 type:complete len:120 (+) Transcript_14299:62-421(+)
MAQGNGKLGKGAKSSGSQRRKAQKNQAYKGRRKVYNPKGKKAVQNREETQTSKAINRRNEAILSAKAINCGTRFFLSDVKEVGKKEINDQLKLRSKKEDREKKLSDRLRGQLRKLGREV